MLYNKRYTTGEDALTQKEWLKLIAVVDNLEDEVLMRLTVAKGFRREDIGHGTIKRRRKGKVVHITTGIKIDNIRFDEKILIFYESKKDRIWNVALNDADITLITKLIKSRGRKQSDFLITYSGRTAHRRLQQYCDKAGIRRRPFHALRATCIKFCTDAGWTEEQISKHTGDTIAVIQMHYRTPSTDEMSELAEEKAII